ncbi:protein TANC1-like isoform X2 [Hylaeus volcanicus]|uniref:protein TANC1-like isoform X2 n=1 Tax=Hylaeus volcanicus TaxID=313075 RepID=UPI0023B7EC8A|nr:protein TANC1-like isoform X2 [Hylaeus volcanicus]
MFDRFRTRQQTRLHFSLAQFKTFVFYCTIVPLMSKTIFNCQRNDSIDERFMWLLRFANLKQIKEFLAKNSQSLCLNYPTVNLKTPLTATIDRGDPQILTLLLEKNSMALNDTLTQPCGRTALMYASFVSRNPEILQALLKKGADLWKTDIGWTCLRYAIVGERLQNVTFLLDSGAFVNRKDFLGRTPLMTSVYLSNLDILSLLLDRGAEINIRDNAGFTALQIGILSRKRDAVIALIERGSDENVVTPSTRASIDELCTTSMPGILRCLERKSKSKSNIL